VSTRCNSWCSSGPGVAVALVLFLALTYNRLAERLEATESTRRSMLADLAHEMRTPLATIDAHLEAVEDGVRALDDDATQARFIRTVRGVGYRMGTGQ